MLRRHTDGESRVDADGSTVREVFAQLVDGRPELEEQLFDGTELRGFINVYVDDEDIRYLEGLDTPVASDDEISIMPAVAGGTV